MSQRDFGELKHALSNVVLAVNNNSTKLNLVKIQLAYLLKRVQKLEESIGIKESDVPSMENNVLKNLSSIDLSG